MKITWVSFIPVALAMLNAVLQVFPAGSLGNTIVNFLLLAVQAFLPRIIKPAV